MRPPRRATSRASRFALLFPLAGAGCGDAPIPRAAEPVAIVQAPGFVVTAPSRSPAAARPPFDLGAWPHDTPLPAAPACVLSRSAFSGRVRLTQEGEPFAHVSAEGATDVHVPQAAPVAPAVVEATLGPLSLRGVVPNDELDFRPTRPLRLGGLLWLQSYADLRVVRAAPDRVVVELDARLDDLTELTAPLEATVRCADLRFDRSDFDPWDELGKPIATSILRAPFVPLGTSPGGPPVARLAIEGGNEPIVSVLARAAGQARIVLDRGDALVVAWVPARSLGPVPSSATGPGGGGTGTGLLGLGESARKTFRTCRAPLAIGVLQGGASARVGTLAAGTALQTEQTVDDLTVVVFEHDALSLRSDARLVARTADLESCAVSGE